MPIWPRSHEAPFATQLPRAASTLLTPAPATWEAAEPAAPDDARGDLADRPQPAGARAAAAAGQLATGQTGDGSEGGHGQWTPVPAL